MTLLFGIVPIETGINGIRTIFRGSGVIGGRWGLCLLLLAKLDFRCHGLHQASSSKMVGMVVLLVMAQRLQRTQARLLHLLSLVVVALEEMVLLQMLLLIMLMVVMMGIRFDAPRMQ